MSVSTIPIRYISISAFGFVILIVGITIAVVVVLRLVDKIVAEIDNVL
jgi:hypothetical protein